jgi:hypothetical protein
VNPLVHRRDNRVNRVYSPPTPEAIAPGGCDQE